jgi:hypothetical protein
MKKVLIAFDGTSFSESAFEFVRRLNKAEPILATGVFVPQLDFANLWSYSAAAGVAGIYIPLVEDEETLIINENIKHFEDLCRKNNVSYRVHKDFFDFALPELKKESRFADVMVISGELFYKRFLETGHLDYLRDLLHISECPVVVIPEQYQFPDNNILAYDGSEEAVYAIKLFAYLFPKLAANRTLLVYAEDDHDKEIPSEEYITELINQHYRDVTFYKLEGNAKKDFYKWMKSMKGSILVSGSFSRSGISEAFRKSFVSDIIKDHQLPVFIAHK